MGNPIDRFLDVKEVENDVIDTSAKKTKFKQKALEISVKEGVAAEFATGVGSQYITPFALALNATPFQIGILSSLSGLASPVSQLFGSSLMARKSRKKIVLRFVLFQALMWIPIAALGLAFYHGFFQELSIYLLIALFTLLTVCLGIMMPSWFSWMGDLVPDKDRGKYFSIRNRAASAASIVAILIGAFVLDFFKTRGIALIGFAIIFVLASIARLVSFIYFHKQYTPRFRVKKSSYFSFWSFLRKGGNFGKFAVFESVFYFALMIASPFFAVYMLEELNFSYITFMAVTLSGSIFYLIFSPIVGRFSDRFGNVRLMYAGAMLFALNPILWIFFKTPISLIFIPQLVSGLANATLVIGTTNFVYDIVTPQKRGICISYKNLMVGIAIFVGSLIGGALIKYGLVFTTFEPFFLVFVVSAVLRFLAGAIFIPRIKEVHQSSEILPPFRLNIAHPFKMIHADVAFFRAITKK